MPVQLINVGYGNFISADKVIAVVDADSAPVKRAVLDARKKGDLVDATLGHKTRSVLVMESGHLVLSAKSTETVAANFSAGGSEGRRSRSDNASSKGSTNGT
jgi:extracellular matrix regulatory protein A